MTTPNKLGVTYADATGDGKQRVDTHWTNEGSGYKTLHCSGAGVTATVTIREPVRFEMILDVLEEVNEWLKPSGDPFARGK